MDIWLQASSSENRISHFDQIFDEGRSVNKTGGGSVGSAVEILLLDVGGVFEEPYWMKVEKKIHVKQMNYSRNKIYCFDLTVYTVFYSILPTPPPPPKKICGN